MYLFESNVMTDWVCLERISVWMLQGEECLLAADLDKTVEQIQHLSGLLLLW